MSATGPSLSPPVRGPTTLPRVSWNSVLPGEWITTRVLSTVGTFDTVSPSVARRGDHSRLLSVCNRRRGLVSGDESTVEESSEEVGGFGSGVEGGVGRRW